MSFTKQLQKKQGKLIRFIREKANLSVKSVVTELSKSEHFSISYTGYCNKEAEHSAFNAFAIPELAEILKTTPWQLMWANLRPDWLDPFKDISDHEHKLKDLFSFTMNDDSLSPDIKEGATLLIKRGYSDFNKPTLLMIEDSNGRHWIRYIKPEMYGEFTMFCHDKKSYPDSKLENLSNLNIIGTVKSITHWI